MYAFLFSVMIFKDFVQSSKNLWMKIKVDPFFLGFLRNREKSEIV